MIGERNRTIHTGLRATTVSMNGMDGLFHCQPCQNPPSQRAVNIAEAADEEEPEAPVSSRFRVQPGPEDARDNVINAGHGDE